MLLLFSAGEQQSPSSRLHCTDKCGCSLAAVWGSVACATAYRSENRQQRQTDRYTANLATGLLSELKAPALLYRLLESQVLYHISDPVKKVGTGLAQVPLTLATGLILFHFLEGTYV